MPTPDDLIPAAAAPGLKRRTVATAAAWTVPAIAVAVGAPSASASPATGGTITINPPTMTTIPGAPLAWTVTATAASGTIDTPLTFTLTLPTGLSFADGTTSKVVTIPASNAGTATLELTGAYQVYADADTTAGTVLTPSTSNVTSGWSVIQVPIVTIVWITIPAGGTGLVWGKNHTSGYGYENFNHYGMENPWATPLTSIDPIPDGTLISLSQATRALAVVASGSGTTVYATDSAFYSNPNAWGTTVVPTPGLRSGEYVLDIGGNTSGSTNQGRIIRLRDSDQTIPTFPTSTDAPHGAFITSVAKDYTAAYSLTYALDSSGKVWVWDGDANNFAYIPRLVIDDATGKPVTDIVEISGATNISLARSASGVVYELYRPNSASFAARQVATGAVKLGKSGTDARSYIGADGKLYSWGLGQTNRHTAANSNDTTAPALNTQANTALALAGASRVIDAAFIYGEAGPDGGTSVVILDDNSVWAWGSDYSSQLGNGTASVTPVRVQAGVNSVTGPLFATAFTYANLSFGAYKA
ncbi:hypothetical protein HQQ81_19630 [Microbacteriaceae bacterium VKM Ac-2854]|nr:hypothetical protein [Microbacteriaceae bacterium VKM Ac-2854]